MKLKIDGWMYGKIDRPTDGRTDSYVYSFNIYFQQKTKNSYE